MDWGRIDTKEELYETFGVPTSALSEGDHMVYTYRSRLERGMGLGFRYFGLGVTLKNEHRVTDVLQVRADSQGRIIEQRLLVPEAPEFQLWPFGE